MRVFPPQVRAYETPSALGPDTRSPGRFLRSLMWQERGLIAASAIAGALWFIPGALNPWLVGRALDAGIAADDPRATWTYAGLLLISVLVGIAGGIAMHTASVASWLVALFRTTKLVARKAMQLGHVMSRRTPNGEVLAIADSDADTFGMFAEVLSRTIGGIVGFAVVIALMLSTSVKLGLLTLIAAPVLVFAATPLLRPLGEARAQERTRSGELTGMATDIVAGLRILRGIGGEATFGDNYARQSQRVKQSGVVAGAWQSAVDSISVLLSGLLLVALTWLGTGEVQAGRLSVGGLLAFFGYAVFLVQPLQTFFEFAQKWVQARVSARKAVALLGQQAPWQEPSDPQPAPRGALVDEASGFVAEPGKLTVIVSAVPDDSAALADRLGRYLPPRDDAHPDDAEESDALKGRAARRAKAERYAERERIAREDEERARARWGVTLGGVDLSQLALADLRRTILVSDASATLFAGTLQEAIDPRGQATREQAEAAMRTASAEDVYDALPGGWQGRLDERGRGLSGGQRQRLILARALLADPEILVLVEPTSAVDAHTEARIAERLQASRAGRTTIVTSVSPLLLHHCDTAVLLVDGRVAARGTHQELLATCPAYRDVVARGMEEER